MTYHLEGRSFRIEGRSHAVAHRYGRSCDAGHVDDGTHMCGDQQCS